MFSIAGRVKGRNSAAMSPETLAARTWYHANMDEMLAMKQREPIENAVDYTRPRWMHHAM